MLLQIRALRRKIKNYLLTSVFEGSQSKYDNKMMQIMLSFQYKEMLRNNCLLPSLDEVGFRVFSENDEDGILHYIFSLIGGTNKKVVDIGAGGIRGSNTANLIVNHGWIGLLIDGDKSARKIRDLFYSNRPETMLFIPRSIQALVTAENVNSILSEHDFTGEVDLLSIDVDGIDYWIWNAIDCISPRVVVVERQNIIGPEKALTVPYQPDFNVDDYDVNRGGLPNYCGASLAAFTKLAKRKGYRLVGCNRFGTNDFFVRSDVGESCLPEVSVESCSQHPVIKYGMEVRFPKVKDMGWEEV